MTQYNVVTQQQIPKTDQSVKTIGCISRDLDIKELCSFCNTKDEIIKSNALAFAIYDRYPVNPGHLLVIPKRHVGNYFNTTAEEKLAFNELIDECKNMLDKEIEPDGYNIGVNCGESAGQNVDHVHIHLIPRYKGDSEKSGRGIRGFICEKKI